MMMIRRLFFHVSVLAVGVALAVFGVSAHSFRADADDGQYFHHVEWIGQPNNYYCGPASGAMILQNVGAETSAFDGQELSVQILATEDYMRTDDYGYTSFNDRSFSSGMNKWLGKDVYTTVHTPTYSQTKKSILHSYDTGYATAVDAQERRGGPHFNGHNNGTFSHIMVVDGYDTANDAIYLADPGAHEVWPDAQEHFWYLSLKEFVANFLTTEVETDGLEHIGIYTSK